MKTKNKILITGGSGFIGTNLIEVFTQNGFLLLNLDIQKPRNREQNGFWQSCDICDYSSLAKSFSSFNPDYVIHLAATTDIIEDKGLEYYKTNIMGVKNIVSLCSKDSNVKRVIFVSSMLVNEVGYVPCNPYDYNPSTLYGTSKVKGEEIIFSARDTLTEFCVVRPTSIWGEWFDAPYRQFFDFVLKEKFFSLGRKSSNKTCGYVLNTVYQLKELLFAKKSDVFGQVFYLGDAPALNIAEWAIDIAKNASVKKPIRLPFVVFKMAAKLGDILLGINVWFPMTGFRLKNMTTDNIIDLDKTYKLCGVPPYSYKEGIRKTVEWLQSDCIPPVIRKQ